MECRHPSCIFVALAQLCPRSFSSRSTPPGQQLSRHGWRRWNVVKIHEESFVGWTFTAGLYYPPDFDQSKLMPVKHLRPKGQKVPLMNIRMMFPFTMICDACSEYNYTGTKFTAKVEKIPNESYLGLSVYRFYGRCKHCWSEFTFKTDPKNSDYTMESGGKRTYEAWKDADMAEAEMKKQKEDAEKDQMKALEQKSIDVQAEMQ